MTNITKVLENYKELFPEYDKRQSFYGKAHVITLENEEILISYETPVAKIIYEPNKEPQALIFGKWSMTTTRHIKEFLRQNRIDYDSTNDMYKRYMIA